LVIVTYPTPFWKPFPQLTVKLPAYPAVLAVAVTVLLEHAAVASVPLLIDDARAVHSAVVVVPASAYVFEMEPLLFESVIVSPAAAAPITIVQTAVELPALNAAVHVACVPPPKRVVPVGDL